MNTTIDSPNPGKPLVGWRVLVPRGGPWGDRVGGVLRGYGAVPVVSPLIDFEPATDTAALDEALSDLAAGVFDWITVTSATTVDVLTSYSATVPESTQVAAVGEATAGALQAAGYRVDLVPSEESSASGLAREFNERIGEPRRVLSLHSDLAGPDLADGLRAAGHELRDVVAYRTVGVPAAERVARDVRNGRINAILITSGSVARQVREQFGDIPEQTVIGAVGPHTAAESKEAGLRVRLVAPLRRLEALIDALAEIPVPPQTPEAAAIPPTEPVEQQGEPSSTATSAIRLPDPEDGAEPAGEPLPRTSPLPTDGEDRS